MFSYFRIFKGFLAKFAFHIEMYSLLMCNPILCICGYMRTVSTLILIHMMLRLNNCISNKLKGVFSKINMMLGLTKLS